MGGGRCPDERSGALVVLGDAAFDRRLQMTLVPENGELAITLRGDLAGILLFAASKKNPGFPSEAGVLDGLLSQGSLVAGTGFEPVTFRL